MRELVVVFNLLMWTFFSGVALASGSGWVSSGGELFRYDKNPWFVKNTQTVKYCVEVDSSGFSASEEDISDAIEEAIAYWKHEFNLKATADPGFLKLATQDFVKRPRCGEEGIDIRFKLGYGTLTKEEIEFLENPQRYVGVAVRTSPYDRVKMKADGFVFISSDQGSHPYENPGHLIERAWQNHKLLKYALIHELGHVFGLPHSGVGLMSEVFLDQLLHKRFSKFYSRGPLKSFLHAPKELTVCTLNGSFNASFFQVPSDTGCLRLQRLDADRYQVYSLKSLSAEPKEAGIVKFTQSTQKALGAKPSTIVHLPPEQEVFGVKERFVNNFMVGPVIQDRGGKGFFRTMDSRRPYPLYIEMKPESVTLVGNVSGRMLPVLVYSPPRLLSLQLPIDNGN